MRQILWFVIGLSLAACVAEPGAKGTAANPIAGEAIETTSLDAPKAGKDGKAVTPAPVVGKDGKPVTPAPDAAKIAAALKGLPDPMAAGRVDDSADTGTAAPVPEKGKGKAPKAAEKLPPAEEKAKLPPGEGGGADPTAAQEADRAAAEAAAEGQLTVPEDDPAVVKSETQLRCEKKGGVFAAPEGSSARGCVKKTRDAGKQCDQDRDCQGQCLARSGTCAPIDPLLGCNEILQDNGVAVTLCIE